MFDNMNGNENFNNKIPINENNLANIYTNKNERNEYNNQQEVTTTNNFPNFDYNFQENSMFNNFNNVNQFNSNENDQNIFSSDNDIPPVLDEITYLNNTPIADVPSMDPLDSMNIINNDYQIQDKLESYESGNLNSYETTNFNNNENFSITSSNEFKEENFNTFSNNLNFENNYSLDTNLFNNGEGNGKTYDYDNNISSNLINDLNLNNDKIINYESNDLNNIDDINNSQNDKQYEIVQDDISLKDDVNEEYSLSNEKIKEDIGLNKDYTIVQDDNLSDNSSSLLNDYNIYDEPDTLEIMDLDIDGLSDNKNQVKEDKSKLENSLYSNVEKIKDLVDELKLNGIKIDIEEFDFEEMFQLIIKIEK